MGCGQPAGEAGLQHRPRRRRPRRPRRRPRRHRQPLLLVEPADDPHGGPRDQGGRGRLLHRRRRRGRQPLRRRAPATRRPTRSSSRPGERTRERAAGRRSRSWTPAEGLPDIYIAMGQTAENVVEAEGVTREEMDEFAARSQQRAVRQRRQRLLRARDHAADARPTARSSAKDDGPRAGTTARGPQPARSRCSGPTAQITAGNACPLNDGAAAVLVMSDTKAKRARPHAAGPHRRLGRHRRSTPRSWASARSRPAARRWRGPA